MTCLKQFSTRTLSLTYKQKRPDLNRLIFNFLVSGVSMRRTALKLNCHYETVYRKFLWLAQLAQNTHALTEFSFNELQFDEMESIEHTKLKPLTIALAVTDQYKILGVQVGTLPAKGILSKIAFNKYGPRENQSEIVTTQLLEGIRAKSYKSDFIIKSDQKPIYSKIVKKVFPEKVHLSFNSGLNKEKRRELKYTKLEKAIFDPLFATNQRMAKFRDHIKRLTRRSWCTTKIKENLEKHIYLYIADNNGYGIV